MLAKRKEEKKPRGFYVVLKRIHVRGRASFALVRQNRVKFLGEVHIFAIGWSSAVTAKVQK